MKQLVLRLLLLLLGVEEFHESLAVQTLANGVPAEPRDRDLVIRLLLELAASVHEAGLGAEEPDLDFCVGVHVNRVSAQPSPQLGVELQLDLLLGVG